MDRLSFAPSFTSAVALAFSASFTLSLALVVVVVVVLALSWPVDRNGSPATVGVTGAGAKL